MSRVGRFKRRCSGGMGLNVDEPGKPSDWSASSRQRSGGRGFESGIVGSEQRRVTVVTCRVSTLLL
jgi:hypothetical protein